MNALSFVAGALLLVLLVAIFYLRAAGLHTKKMNEEQARLNKKTGTHSPPDSPLASVSITTRMTGFVKGSNLVAFLFGIVGIGLLWWLYQSNLTVTGASDWVWKRLVFSIVLAAVVTGFLAWFFPEQEWAMWTAPVVLVVLIVVHLVAGQSSTIPPHRPAHSGRSALLKKSPANKPHSKWERLWIPAGGTSEFIPLPYGMHNVVVRGAKYQLYTTYEDGRECHSFGEATCPDGGVTGNYIVNEAEKDIVYNDTFFYAFVSK